jgi:hypothetical protein
MLRRVRFFLMPSAVIAVVAMAGGPRYGSGVEGPGALSGGQNRYRVRLGSVDLVPKRGFHAVAAARGEPFLLQLEEVPELAVRSGLEEAGVELLGYVGGRSYLARCEGGCGAGLASLPVRSTVDLVPEMKLAPVFQTDIDLRNRLHSKSPLEVAVRFFPWVPWEQARFVLEQCGAASSATRPGYRNSVTAMVDAEVVLERLGGRSEVAWVEPALPATGPSLVNAAERSLVDQVRGAAEFLGADGSGTRVGVLDWFPAGVHGDLAGRVTPVDVRWGEDEHGVTVSGCIAGAGTLEPRATGMAPGADLYWTSWVPDPWTAIERLHDEHGVTIVNNSWNAKPGWWLDTHSWHGDLWAFGFYHERAGAADALVRDTDLLVLFSGGDKRQVSFLGPHTHGDQYGSEDGLSHEDLHPPNPRYPSIAGAAVAKNVLTVGGTTKDDGIDIFSSFGPTGDGRVKPDLVAVGLDVLTTAAADGYVSTNGTSISSAVVAGVAALLTDYARRRHGRDPSSSVLKALLIHSTRDLGEPGPDYQSGFGMADAELAARVLDAAGFDDALFRPVPRRPGSRMGAATPTGKSTGSVGTANSPVDRMRSLVIQEVLDQGESGSFVLPVTNSDDELRATLVWHDPPGPALVNDLDLRVVAPDGHVVLPFVPDPDNPFTAASRGINHRDNVEQIRVRGPMAGRWRILVEGTAVADGPQELALIASAGEGNRAPERLFEGDFVIDEFFATGDDSSVQEPSPWTVFRDDDQLNFYIESTILANADYGDFFGSIALTTFVSDADGETIVRYRGSGHATGPGPLRFLFAVGLEIPAEMPAGDYTAHAELTMHNGVRRTADYPFTVEIPG